MPVVRPASAFLAVLALLAASLVRPLHAQDPETRSAWVTEDRFARTADAEATIKRLADAGFNLALVRTWYGGATIYPSAVVERAGGPRQQGQFAGRDPLADLIQIGRRHGVRIGVWMEYGLAERITSPGGPGPILTAHPEWRMVGRTGLDHVAHAGGTRSYWMDPAHPEVRAFVRDLFAEVAGRYPDLAVVEYDRFRYPDPTFSYSATSIAAYRAATGETDPLPQPTYAPFVTWRRSVITRMAGEVYRAVKAANPSTTVSAAVVPPYMLNGSDNKMQDWPTWADSGYVDALDPMFYGTVPSYETWVSQGRVFVGGKVPLYPGAQVSGNSVVDLVAVVRRQKVGGITFWYESDLTAADMTGLRAGPFAQRVLPEFDDRRADDADATTTFTGPWTTQATGDRGTSRRIEAGQTGTATWKVPLRHGGDYDVYARWPSGTGLASEAWLRVDGWSDDPVGTSFPFDPRAGGDTWVRVGTVRVGGLIGNRNPTLVLSLRAAADGAVVADGVRLVRVQPMRVEEVVPDDLRTLTVRTTYRVGTVHASNFSVYGPGGASVGVVSAVVDPSDARVVRLTLGSDLTAGATYTLASGLTSVEGYRSLPGETLAFTATATPGFVVDDGDSGFLVVGTWTPTATGGHDDDYRTASAGASAIWNGKTTEAGRYVLEVYLPPAAATNAATQTYQIGVPGGAVTVTVPTTVSGWQSLGAYAFDANASVLVRLASASGGAGVLTADAVRWRRTIGVTTSVPAPASPSAASLRLWPNPARDVLRLALDGVDGAATLDVVDALGRVVAMHRLDAGVDAAVPVSELAPGLYVAVVRAGGAAPVLLRRAFVRRP